MRSFFAMMVTAAFVVAAPMAQSETLSDALIAAYKNSNLLETSKMAGRARPPLKKSAKAAAGLSLSDYLQKILTARVYDVAIETPLDLAKSLSRRLGNQVLLKREDQPFVQGTERSAVTDPHVCRTEHARHQCDQRQRDIENDGAVVDAGERVRLLVVGGRTVMRPYASLRV